MPGIPQHPVWSVLVLNFFIFRTNIIVTPASTPQGFEWLCKGLWLLYRLYSVWDQIDLATLAGMSTSWVLTPLHHRGWLVEEGGQAVIDSALLCYFKGDHGTRSCHEFCCPRKRMSQGWEKPNSTNCPTVAFDQNNWESRSPASFCILGNTRLSDRLPSEHFLPQKISHKSMQTYHVILLIVRWYSEIPRSANSIHIF